MYVFQSPLPLQPSGILVKCVGSMLAMGQDSVGLLPPIDSQNFLKMEVSHSPQFFCWLLKHARSQERVRTETEVVGTLSQTTGSDGSEVEPKSTKESRTRRDQGLVDAAANDSYDLTSHLRKVAIL